MGQREVEMNRVFGFLRVLVFLVPLVLCSCGSPDGRKPAVQVEQHRAAVITEVPNGICPYLDRYTEPPEGVDYNYYVSDSLMETSDMEPTCGPWFAQKEARLCAGYFWFQVATGLYPGMSAGGWVEKQRYFRKAVESVLDVVFDTQDFGEWNHPAFSEDKLIGECTDPLNPMFPVELLKYFRGLKLQAMELYKKIAEQYQYSLTAAGDAARTTSGTTAAYSNLVWGTAKEPGEGLLQFLELEGFRGLSTAFLIGADITFLDRVVQQEFETETTAAEQCGWELGSPGKYLPDNCDRRALVPLPPCRQSGRSKPVSKALTLLRQYGVPLSVWSTGHELDGDQIATFLLYAINKMLEVQGELPLHDEADLLERYETDTEALASASRYLEDLGRVRLFPIQKKHVMGRDYLLGFAASGEDMQRLLVTGQVNGSRLGHEDEIPPIVKNAVIPGASGEEFPTIEYNFHKHAYFKALSAARALAKREVLDSYWQSYPNGSLATSEQKEALSEPYQKLIALVDDEIGKEEIWYAVTLLQRDHQGQTETKTYQVDLGIPQEVLPAGVDPSTLVDVVSGRVLPSGTEPGSALTGDILNGLRCRTFGWVGSEACEPASYRVAVTPGTNPVSPADMPAGFQRYHFKVVTSAFKPPVDRMLEDAHPVFVYLNGKLVDSLFFEYGRAWRTMLGPTGPGPEYHPHWLRNQYALPATDRVQKIVQRSLEQCSEPQYNSLGLDNVLVPPQENELVSPGGYEDSFRYYLTKAQDAASQAESKIADANGTLTKELLFENEVDAIRAKASNTVAAICGEDRPSCDLGFSDYPLSELWAPPDMEIEFNCCPTVSWNQWCYRDMEDPPSVVTPDDLVHAGHWLRCRTKKLFEDFKDVYFFRDLPDIVADDPYLRKGTVFSIFEGELLSELLGVNNALLDFLKTADKIVLLQSTMGIEIAAMNALITAREAQIGAAELEKSMNFMSGLLGAVVAAITMGTTSAPTMASVTSAGKAGTTLANLPSQWTADELKVEVQQLQMDAQLKQGLVWIVTRYAELEVLYATMIQNLIKVSQGSIKVRLLSQKAKQALNDAERQETAELEELVSTRCEGQEQQCLKYYRNLFNVKHERALESLRRAQKMAFIAKRALELKLGLDFTRERAQGVIMDGPATWQDELYTLFSDQELYDANDAGSYVRKLEDYLFGYPFDHPFADEDDVAIISLRDDLLATRSQKQCLVPVLPQGNYATNSEAIDLWLPDSSLPFNVDRDVERSPLSPPTMTAELVNAPDAGGLDTFRLVSREAFYDPGPGGFPDPTFELNASIYAKAAQGQESLALTVVYRRYQRGTYKLLDTITAPVTRVTVGQGASWPRVSQVFTFPRPEADQHATVALEVSGTGSMYLWGAQITAGPTLQPYQPNPRYSMAEGCEELSWLDPYTGGERSGYFPTLETQYRQLREAFRVKCVNEDELYPFTDLSMCGTHENLEYFETDFTIAYEEILSGKILKQGQFAVGNYNFRVEDLAVNLVGRPNMGELDPSIALLPVKDCSLDPEAGASCELNRFIPYDLTHAGSVEILDYEGKANRFTMNTGVIHYAKALANQQAPLSNPIASGDLSLIGPYIKSELRGRPIHSTYTLRIWNVPGLAWQNLADVQIYMKYRYWSSFSNP